MHSNYVEVNQIHNHNTRLAARGHWYQPQQRRNVEQMGRIPRKYTEIWNSIPYNLKQVGKASAFKRELKTYLLQKQDEKKSYKQLRTSHGTPPRFRPREFYAKSLWYTPIRGKQPPLLIKPCLSYPITDNDRLSSWPICRYYS